MGYSNGIKLFVLIMLSSILLACSSAVQNPAEKYSKVPEQTLYYDAINHMSGHSFKEAIEQLEALDARYPFGEFAEQQQLFIIYAYYRAGQIPEALVSADRFIHLHPDSKHVDYAYFMKGVLNYRQNQGVFEKYFPSDLSERDLSPAQQSFVTFATLVNDYPKSPYRRSAIAYMTYLRNMMAEQQVKIAQFYYERKAYIAASNRANLVIMHYQGAPVMQQAIEVAINCYQQLHLTGLAELYQQIIALNYPEPEISSAKK